MTIQKYNSIEIKLREAILEIVKGFNLTPKQIIYFLTKIMLSYNKIKIDD